MCVLVDVDKMVADYSITPADLAIFMARSPAMTPSSLPAQLLSKNSISSSR
jgi:hypothetical protein